MNERITLLALKASDPKTGWLDRQKFAELIVRECEEVVRWAISVDSTIEKVPVLIREHFGVEE